jgi:hypothetical protein
MSDEVWFGPADDALMTYATWRIRDLIATARGCRRPSWRHGLLNQAGIYRRELASKRRAYLARQEQRRAAA